jgi:dTDP-glucose 4,6-dehydratase
MPGEIYNIGGRNELTNLELVKLIVGWLGNSEENFEFVQDRKGHDLRYSVDTAKIEQATGFKPQMEFEHGILETINWYRENEHWWMPLVKEL